MFAQKMKCSLYLVHYLRFQSPLYAPFKYILQAVKTLRILFRERPHVIHAANPPFVCGMMVFIYCLVTSARYVLDHHSAAFASVWRWALPIQKYLARKAVTNIVTNQHWAGIIRSWNAEVFTLLDPFLDPDKGQDYVTGPGFNLVYISTFAPDEPVSEVVKAAGRLPDVTFYITGKTRRMSKDFFEKLPQNVICTGFLPDEQYIGLLRAADAVMALTTRDFTLQRGGCEAISVGKPLIISDWPFLKEVFYGSAVFVPNTAEGIYAGIKEMRKDYNSLKKNVLPLYLRRKKETDIGLAQLQEIVAQKPETRNQE